MKICFIDTEVKSEVDLKLVGAARYFQHPSTHTIIVTYHEYGGILGTRAWDVTKDATPPTDLQAMVDDPQFIFAAFNASFDLQAMENLGLFIPLERWVCLMVAALAFGFQGGLNEVLERFDIPYRKEREGLKLIRKFCMPQPKNRIVRNWDRHNAPEDWKRFIKYGKKDTTVLVPLYEKLSLYGKNVDWYEWRIDQKINRRGIPIDMRLVNKAITVAEEEKKYLVERLIEITGLENPNSKAQLKCWLRDSEGLNLANMQKGTVALALTNTKLTEAARSALLLNQQLAKTSTSKWDTLGHAVNDEGRLCYAHQYIGAARTGRDAHRRFQPGNLPRGTLHDPVAAAEVLSKFGREEVDLIYGNVMEVLSSTVRCAITAPKGFVLPVADLSGIEGRVLPWLCGFQSKLDKIEAGLDMYVVTHSEMEGIPYDMVDDAGRFEGKVSELSFGFQGAVGAYNQWLETFGREKVPDSVGLGIVRKWREKNEPIVKYWYACDDAVKLVISNPGKEKVVGKASFQVREDFLFITLPSGRRLAYYKPQYGGKGFSYMGLNGYTHKWERIDSFGGKIVENITQAVARDVFFHGLRLYEHHPTSVGESVLRVHDEIVGVVDSRFAVQELAIMCECMTVVPEWAEGLPLDAKGFITKRYKKG